MAGVHVVLQQEPDGGLLIRSLLQGGQLSQMSERVLGEEFKLEAEQIVGWASSQQQKTMTERPRSPEGTTKAALPGLSTIHFCTSSLPAYFFAHSSMAESDATDQ